MPYHGQDLAGRLGSRIESYRKFQDFLPQQCTVLYSPTLVPELYGRPPPSLNPKAPDHLFTHLSHSLSNGRRRNPTNHPKHPKPQPARYISSTAFPFRETSPWLSRYTTSADETIYIQHSRLQTVSEIFFWGFEDEGGLMVRNIFFSVRWDGMAREKGRGDGRGKGGWVA
jgi:hypothetical protein